MCRRTHNTSPSIPIHTRMAIPCGRINHRNYSRCQSANDRIKFEITPNPTWIHRNYLGFSWLGSAPVTLWCNPTNTLAIDVVAYKCWTEKERENERNIVNVTQTPVGWENMYALKRAFLQNIEVRFTYVATINWNVKLRCRCFIKSVDNKCTRCKRMFCWAYFCVRAHSTGIIDSTQCTQATLINIIKLSIITNILTTYWQHESNDEYHSHTWYNIGMILYDKFMAEERWILIWWFSS